MGDSDDGYGASRFGASRLHGLLITTRTLGTVLRRLWMAFMGVAGGVAEALDGFYGRCRWRLRMPGRGCLRERKRYF